MFPSNQFSSCGRPLQQGGQYDLVENTMEPLHLPQNQPTQIFQFAATSPTDSHDGYDQNLFQYQYSQDGDGDLSAQSTGEDIFTFDKDGKEPSFPSVTVPTDPSCGSSFRDHLKVLADKDYLGIPSAAIDDSFSQTSCPPKHFHSE